MRMNLLGYHLPSLAWYMPDLSPPPFIFVFSCEVESPLPRKAERPQRLLGCACLVWRISDSYAGPCSFERVGRAGLVYVDEDEERYRGCLRRTTMDGR